MKLYVVRWSYYDGSNSIEGVFSTRQLAEARVNGYKKDDWFFKYLEIIETELDKEMSE